MKVVVFHCRSRPPTYPTPLMTLHRVGLESSSTGSSFPAVFVKPQQKKEPFDAPRSQPALEIDGTYCAEKEAGREKENSDDSAIKEAADKTNCFQVKKLQ
ncbi:unnamed protein product [Toxocara canis]|uniref:Uncharacterized protein n=1 Tax=Toxocara canis TaxID=6265 RepID=A0A183URG4_TOXCA|nr:unnamed protein product [Toxocara canis]